MATERTDRVIAYYANPKTGKVEKHDMSSVNWMEATRPRMLQDERGRPKLFSTGEEHLWTKEPPKNTKPDDIDDFTPAPLEVKAMDSAPPPALQRDHLRDRPSARG